MTVPVIIDGARMLVEISSADEMEVAVGDVLRIDDFLETIESFARALLGTLKKIAPDKATAEFSVEVAVESGALTTLLVKGSGKGNVKITLEWSRS